MTSKNIKKSIILTSAIACIILPASALAAWYNPVTWFKKSTVNIPATVDNGAKIESKREQQPIITNTITVENPKLQAQINALIKNNSDLQSENANLLSKYNSLVSENTSLKEKLKAVSEENAVLKTEHSEVIPSIESIDTKIFKSAPGKYYKSYTLKVQNNSNKSITIDSIFLPGNGMAYVSTIYPNDINKDSFSELYTQFHVKNNLIIPANSYGVLYIITSPDSSLWRIEKITATYSDGSLVTFTGLPVSI